MTIFSGMTSGTNLKEPGRVVGSFKVPERMVNAENFLRSGAMLTLAGLVSSVVLTSLGAPTTGDSFETYIPPYLDTVYVDEEVEVESKVLSIGKIIGVVSIDLRDKKTGKSIYFKDGGGNRSRL